MILIIVVICQLVIGLLIDLFIYRSYIASSGKRWVRLTYILQAIILDVLLLGSVPVAQSLMEPMALMVYMVWVVYFFMVGFFAKFIFSIFAFSRLIARRYRPYNHYRWLTALGIVMAAGIVLTMVYGNAIGRTQIRVERIEIASNRIPSSFDGYTIALFSDAHIGNLGASSDFITEVVSTINRLSPDIVVQGGDLVNIVSSELNAFYMDELSKIKAPLYSVLGNHDLGYYIQDQDLYPPLASVENLKIKQAEMGWILLDNDRVFIKRGTDSIALAGITFPSDIGHNGTNSIAGGSNLRLATRGVNDSTYLIMVSHTPKIYDSIMAIAAPDLTLSGHMHSMQIKFTIGDWSWSPAAWVHPQYSGLYEQGEHKLYVNDGVGFVGYPMRIGTKPEITLITLRSRS